MLRKGYAENSRASWKFRGRKAHQNQVGINPCLGWPTPTDCSALSKHKFVSGWDAETRDSWLWERTRSANVSSAEKMTASVSELAGLEIQLPLHFLFAFKTNSRLLLMFWKRLFPLEINCSAEAVWTITLVLIRTAGNCCYWGCLWGGCCGFHPKQCSPSLLFYLLPHRLYLFLLPWQCWFVSTTSHLHMCVAGRASSCPRGDAIRMVQFNSELI